MRFLREGHRVAEPPFDLRTAEMIRLTKSSIDEQIEVVAKAVCDGGETERAMCVLAGLTRRLAMLETRAVWPSVVIGPSPATAPPPPSVPSSGSRDHR